ncbi:MAG: permease [Oscillospiraceae bacterium]
MNLVLILQVVLAICFLGITLMVCFDVNKNHKGELYGGSAKKWGWCLGIGFICNLLDTLGIGSFAPSTFLYKAGKVIDDIDLPGTLNVGDTFPVIFEALIFTTSVDCDPVFLVVMCVASMIGSYGGAEIVTKWSRNMIRYGMAIFLVLAGVVMIVKTLGLGPFSLEGTAIGLTGWKFAVAVVGNLIFGALMDIGFGLYAPCMALCMLLGVDAGACFPVFMGSCALLMPANSIVFIKKSRYDVIAVFGNMIGGIFGVLIAWKVVTSLPIKYLTFIVAVVMLWVAYSMIRDARRDAAKGIA